jgi:hypothetical protein
LREAGDFQEPLFCSGGTGGCDEDGGRGEGFQFTIGCICRDDEGVGLADVDGGGVGAVEGDRVGEGDDDGDGGDGGQRVGGAGLEFDADDGEEIVFDELGDAGGDGCGRDFSGGGLGAQGFEAEVNVQLAVAAVVVEAVGEVGLLLTFEEDDAGADGVDGAGVDEDEVAGFDGELIEQRLQSVVVDGGADIFGGDAGAESESDGGAGLGGEDIPTLGLAAGVAGGLGESVVGMDLHGELVVGKDEFDEERKFGEGGDGGGGGVEVGLAEDFGAAGGHDSGQGEAGEVAGEDAAVISGEPGFADEFGSRDDGGVAGGEPGGEIVGSPGAWAEVGRENERSDRRGHAGKDTAGRASVHARMRR